MMTRRHCGHWAAMALFLAASAATGGAAGDAVNDYEDFQQAPIRNADLAKIVEDAELIAVVNFDPKKLLAETPPPSRWAASVLQDNEGFRQTKFKGSCGRQIQIEGDLKAFEDPAGPYVSPGGFVPRNNWLVFLKAAGADGLHKCIEAVPGGLRQYGGRGPSDHRTLIVGQANGRLAVEGGRGYQTHRMCGATNLRDAMEGLQTGLKLTAAAKGGAAVELRLEKTGRGSTGIPKSIALVAPVLWAEVEGPEGDTVLLAPDDYVVSKLADPYKAVQQVTAENPVMASVELPTGPVPKGASLLWAKNNHAKPLAGSLPQGECMVRLLFRPTPDSLLLSNPVTVTGKAGGAGPAQLAALEKPSQFAPLPDTPPAQGLPPLAEAARGEIWFDTNRDGNWEIYVMKADGSNALNVTRTEDRGEFGPVPSQDGRRVAYHVGDSKKAGDGGMWGRWNPSGKSVWVMDRDGKNAKKLADEAITPAWWPDGKSVLYGRNKQLVMHNLETGEAKPLLTSVSSWLKLSPAPLSFAPATRTLLCGGGLHSTPSAMTLAVELDENAEFKDFRVLTTIYRGCTQRWTSPEGRRVIWAHHDPKYAGDIILWTMKPDGTDARRFWRNSDRWPGYGMYCESPDGTMFAHSCGNDIVVVRFADGASLPLTHKQGVNQAPFWHPGAKAN